MHDPKPGGGWADGKAFRTAFLVMLIAAGVISAALGFLPAFQKKEPHFEIERFGAFFAIYGFVAFAFIVLAGQHLRKLVGRKETYYDERE
jgi:threonine/homoserine/homoserine lactone efflux protein